VNIRGGDFQKVRGREKSSGGDRGKNDREGSKKEQGWASASRRASSFAYRKKKKRFRTTEKGDSTNSDR